MLAKGYSELTGLFRSLESDAVSLAVFVFLAWTAGYSVRFPAISLPTMPEGFTKDDFKLVGELGGLAIVAAAISLTIFIIQNLLSLGYYVSKFVDRMLPRSLFRVPESPPNLQALTYIAASLPEDQRTPEQIRDAYAFLKRQRGIIQTALDADGNQKYLQSRGSFYYALRSRMLFFVVLVIAIHYLDGLVSRLLVEGDLSHLLMALLGCALILFILERLNSRTLFRRQEELLSSAIETSELWKDAVSSAAKEWPKPYKAAVEAMMFMVSQERRRTKTLAQHLFFKVGRIFWGLGWPEKAFNRIEQQVRDKSMQYANGQDDSWLTGYLANRVFNLILRVKLRAQQSFLPPRDLPMRRVANADQILASSSGERGEAGRAASPPASPAPP